MEDLDLLACIGVSGFYTDPVLSWVFRDGTRPERLQAAFFGVVPEYLGASSRVDVVDDARMTLWRDPSFEAAPTVERHVPRVGRFEVGGRTRCIADLGGGEGVAENEPVASAAGFERRVATVNVTTGTEGVRCA